MQLGAKVCGVIFAASILSMVPNNAQAQVSTPAFVNQVSTPTKSIEAAPVSQQVPPLEAEEIMAPITMAQGTVPPADTQVSSDAVPLRNAKPASNADNDDESLKLSGAVSRRGYPAPFDPIFPMTEWIGADHMYPIGVPDSGATYPFEKMMWKKFPLLAKSRIRMYGWANPGWNYSTSNNSNQPLSYAIVPRVPQLDQLVFRVERVPDTVQTKHMDWGFRFSGLFGIDYRWTTAQGWGPASNSLLNHNYLYGFDPVECYGVLYFPKIAKGATLKFGRYISPPDIEAQLAPDNFLWSHSLMFTYDTYTQTGAIASVKLNDQWTAQAGIHAGNDMAPWNVAAIPTAQAFLKWTSKRNNDSIYGGVCDINNGRYRLAREVNNSRAIVDQLNSLGSQLTPAITFNMPKIPAHDNLQQFNLTWSHRFNKRGTVITMTEAYLLYSIDALTGGTVNNGPPRRFFTGVGPGTFLPGTSLAWGVVNYTAFKISPKDFIVIRPVDYLGDPRGWRTGFAGTFTSWTVGWTHRFNDKLCIRPEIRYETALNNATPWNNGTKGSQFTFGGDLIYRF